MLKVFLVKGNVVKIPSGNEFLNINFTGIQEILFSTNDLEASQIRFNIPTDVAKDNHPLVIMTGEEELHYYTGTVRVN
jgi:hypothetical protein